MLLKSKLRRKKEPTFRRAPSGSMPGTLLTNEAALPTRIHVTAYNHDRINEFKDVPVSSLKELAAASYSVLWIEVVGLGSPEVLKKLARLYDIHPLALEDIVNLHQRAKVEAYNRHLLVFLNSLYKGDQFEKKQISIFIAGGVVITFHEAETNNFQPIKERLFNSHGKMRSQAADYLAYAIIDAIIDDYFPVAETYSQTLDELEDAILRGSVERSVVKEIHDLKVKISALHQLTWNHKEMLTLLTREEQTLISHESRVYLRDCYDHTLQILDYLARLKDSSLALMDLYFSLETSTTNDVMKVLTFISSMFLPLTFLTGLYGMNFNTEVSPWNMPELSWVYGYPFALGLMACAVLSFLAYFYRRGWISFGRRR